MDGGAWKAAVHGITEGQIRLSIFTFTFHLHALEKEMATHSSVLAWRIPGTGEPGGLLSVGSHRVGHDWSDLAAAAAPSPSPLLSVLSLTPSIQLPDSSQSSPDSSQSFPWLLPDLSLTPPRPLPDSSLCLVSRKYPVLMLSAGEEQVGGKVSFLACSVVPRWAWFSEELLCKSEAWDCKPTSNCGSSASLSISPPQGFLFTCQKVESSLVQVRLEGRKWPV